MKILVVSESPLRKIHGDYYGVDPWISIPQHLSSYYEKTTLLSPVSVDTTSNNPPSDSWKIKLGNLRIEHLDNYRRYIEYYALLIRRFRVWRKKIDQLMQEHDVVVLRAPSPITSLIVSSARKAGRPLVYMILSNIVTQPDQLYTGFFLKRFFFYAVTRGLVAEEGVAVRQSALTYAYSKEIADRYKSLKHKIKICQDPHVSLKDFYHREDTCSSNEIRILRICWLIPSKGVEYLIQALSLINKKGVSARLEIVGQERSPGYQKKLQDYAKQLGIDDRIHFTGWVPFDRISEVYQRNDIQVISSLAEGTPRCIVEGFARGLPLISTNVGGSRDFLNHEQNALLVSPADSVAIADAVERLASDKTLRKKMIQTGYNDATSVSFENLGMNIMNDIERVVKNY